MAQWDGKSKGALFGYKIFIFFIRKLGVRSAYFILYFVALYYLFFSVKGTKANFYYFHKRLKYSKFNSFFKVYKSYYTFGQTIIDKFAISFGMSKQFTYSFDGDNNIKRLLENKKGGILISAHVGNFEIADYFLSELNNSSQISLVTTDNEHQAIKSYLDKFSLQSNMKFIIVKDDLSHIFQINESLRNNELICVTGDRYFEGNKTLSEKLLGQEANFPAGAFLLGSRLNVPVLFLYIMKKNSKHYQFYAREVKFIKRDAQDLLKKYTESIEEILKKYPYQWFNYFDFWNDIK